jgi:cytochrome c oxidase accessory protein FixG
MATLKSIQPASAAAKAILPGTRYHRIRKTVQLVCFIAFILLPLFNIIRFDIPHERFYFFGTELWISEFSIIFLTMMFLMFSIAAVAMLYGRIYCGYLCPQMIFSEAANTLEAGIKRMVNRRFSGFGAIGRRVLSVALFSAALLPAAVFVSFVFISFFVQPADLFQRLLSLDIRTSGGILGASVTLVTLLDFAFLRQRFCTAICPYGYLQNMLADKNTLLVHFHDANGKCIHCDKCVRACPMGIDIRRSSHQLECTHCAECIDACSAILGKLGRESLIQYAWGDAGDNAVKETAWYRRIGLRDGKRIFVLLLMVIYASGLSIAISLRQPVLVRIMPNRITLYTIGSDGLVHNRFRLVAINRGKTDAKVTFSLADLPAVKILGVEDGVTLKPEETLQREFDIAAAASGVGPGVNHLRILTQVTPAQKSGEFQETFIAPMEHSPAPAGK